MSYSKWSDVFDVATSSFIRFDRHTVPKCSSTKRSQSDSNTGVVCTWKKFLRTILFTSSFEQILGKSMSPYLKHLKKDYVKFCELKRKKISKARTMANWKSAATFFVESLEARLRRTSFLRAGRK